MGFTVSYYSPTLQPTSRRIQQSKSNAAVTLERSWRLTSDPEAAATDAMALVRVRQARRECAPRRTGALASGTWIV
jgi:hypothetical protein